MVHRDKPADFNPFAVDHAYFTELALDKSVILTYATNAGYGVR